MYLLWNMDILGIYNKFTWGYICTSCTSYLSLPIFYPSKNLPPRRWWKCSSKRGTTDSTRQTSTSTFSFFCQQNEWKTCEQTIHACFWRDVLEDYVLINPQIYGNKPCYRNLSKDNIRYRTPSCFDFPPPILGETVYFCCWPGKSEEEESSAKEACDSSFGMVSGLRNERIYSETKIWTAGLLWRSFFSLLPVNVLDDLV